MFLNNLTEMLKGVLEGLVLEVIGQKESYGYEITKRLNELGFGGLVEGTVYAVLIRLERDKLVTIQKVASTQGPPRKLYSLNNAGRGELANFWERWDFMSDKLKNLKGEEE